MNEELIGVLESEQVNSDRTNLVKQLMDKNRELEELVKTQQEQIEHLKQLANWNEFVYLVKDGQYEPVEIIPSLPPRILQRENLFIRSFNSCIRYFKELPPKEWFLENNIQDYIKNIGQKQDIYIKTHIDNFYSALVDYYGGKRV